MQARLTQIMNLLMLAPEIQEEILFLPMVERGRDELLLMDLQQVAGVKDEADPLRSYSTT